MIISHWKLNFILICLICFSCKDPEKTIPSLYTIPVNIKKAKSADFNELFDTESLEKVRLDPEVLLDEIDKFSLNDDFIFVSDNDKLVAFQHDGTFAWQIDRKGKGPEEYTSIRDFRVSATNEIYIFSGEKILYYILMLTRCFSNHIQCPYQACLFIMCMAPTNF